MPPLTDLLTLVLATWYLSYALTKTHGAFGMFSFIREHFALGGLTSCIICAAFWIGALFFVLWLTPARVVVYPFALAGGAVLVGSYTGANRE